MNVGNNGRKILKTQKYNIGELAELKVNIEKEIVESLSVIAEASGRTVDDIVVIALKRFRASHTDLEGRSPKTE
jgi:fructose-1,6-bisphosphatase/sedoheptulose 1,7-bisphosphatase-like protein